MPSSPTSQDGRQWRESWPPVQVQLAQPSARTVPAPADARSLAVPQKNAERDQEIHIGGDNPLAYFLTPATLSLGDDDDGDSYIDDDDSSYYYDEDSTSAMDFEFDAGIEDAATRQPTVRSVSPSSLANSLGGRLPWVVRPPTPPRSHAARQIFTADAAAGTDTFDAADDDDDEHYIHSDAFGRGAPKASNAYARGSAIPSVEYSSSPPSASRSAADIHNYLSNACSPHSSSLLSSSPTAASAHGRVGAMIVRRRSPRSWRMPSPDVFSIEEEPEEDLAQAATGQRSYLDAGAAKPQKKQVRFVLPNRAA